MTDVHRPQSLRRPAAPSASSDYIDGVGQRQAPYTHHVSIDYSSRSAVPGIGRGVRRRASSGSAIMAGLSSSSGVGGMAHTISCSPANRALPVTAGRASQPLVSLGRGRGSGCARIVKSSISESPRHQSRGSMSSGTSQSSVDSEQSPRSSRNNSITSAQVQAGGRDSGVQNNRCSVVTVSSDVTLPMSVSKQNSAISIDKQNNNIMSVDSVPPQNCRTLVISAKSSLHDGVTSMSASPPATASSKPVLDFEPSKRSPVRGMYQASMDCTTQHDRSAPVFTVMGVGPSISDVIFTSASVSAEASDERKVSEESEVFSSTPTSAYTAASGRLDDMATMFNRASQVPVSSTMAPSNLVPVTTSTSTSSGQSWRDTSQSLPTFPPPKSEAHAFSATLDLYGCGKFFAGSRIATGGTASQVHASRSDSAQSECPLDRLRNHPIFDCKKTPEQSCTLKMAEGKFDKVVLTAPNKESLERGKAFLISVTKILKPYVLHNHHLVDLGKYDATTGAMLMEEGERTKFALPTNVLQDVQTGNLYALIQDITPDKHVLLVDVVARVADILNKIKSRHLRRGSGDESASTVAPARPSSSMSARPTVVYSRHEMLLLYSSPLSSRVPAVCNLSDPTVIFEKPQISIQQVVGSLKNET